MITKGDIFNIETLGKLTGLNRRTIRYYIQRGVLQKPYGGGRGHYYTSEHVERIREIQRLRQQGVPLDKMREIFAGSKMVSARVEKVGPSPSSSPDIREEVWRRLIIGDAVEICFREGVLSEEEKQDILNFIQKTLTRKEGNHA